MIIQLCGLSGTGKSTLARAVETTLARQGWSVEIIDGDEYRKTLCQGLGFSEKDRMENVRRMAFVAAQLSKHGVIVLICAINPYEKIREEIREQYLQVKTVHIDCSIQTLRQRDTKGLYLRAFLPDDHPEKISNLTGINDPFDIPVDPDLYINTDIYSVSDCHIMLVKFILSHCSTAKVIELTGNHSVTNFIYN